LFIIKVRSNNNQQKEDVTTIIHQSQNIQNTINQSQNIQNTIKQSQNIQITINQSQNIQNTNTEQQLFHREHIFMQDKLCINKIKNLNLTENSCKFL